MWGDDEGDLRLAGKPPPPLYEDFDTSRRIIATWHKPSIYMDWKEGVDLARRYINSDPSPWSRQEAAVDALFSLLLQNLRSGKQARKRRRVAIFSLVCLVMQHQYANDRLWALLLLKSPVSPHLSSSIERGGRVDRRRGETGNKTQLDVISLNIFGAGSSKKEVVEEQTIFLILLWELAHSTTSLEASAGFKLARLISLTNMPHTSTSKASVAEGGRIGGRSADKRINVLSEIARISALPRLLQLQRSYQDLLKKKAELSRASTTLKEKLEGDNFYQTKESSDGEAAVVQEDEEDAFKARVFEYEQELFRIEQEIEKNDQGLINALSELQATKSCRELCWSILAQLCSMLSSSNTFGTLVTAISPPWQRPNVVTKDKTRKRGKHYANHKGSRVGEDALYPHPHHLKGITNLGFTRVWPYLVQSGLLQVFLQELGGDHWRRNRRPTTNKEDKEDKGTDEEGELKEEKIRARGKQGEEIKGIEGKRSSTEDYHDDDIGDENSEVLRRNLLPILCFFAHTGRRSSETFSILQSLDLGASIASFAANVQNECKIHVQKQSSKTQEKQETEQRSCIEYCYSLAWAAVLASQVYERFHILRMIDALHWGEDKNPDNNTVSEQEMFRKFSSRLSGLSALSLSLSTTIYSLRGLSSSARGSADTNSAWGECPTLPTVLQWHPEMNRMRVRTMHLKLQSASIPLYVNINARSFSWTPHFVGMNPGIQDTIEAIQRMAENQVRPRVSESKGGTHDAKHEEVEKDHEERPENANGGVPMTLDEIAPGSIVAAIMSSMTHHGNAHASGCIQLPEIFDAIDSKEGDIEGPFTDKNGIPSLREIHDSLDKHAIYRCKTLQGFARVTSSFFHVASEDIKRPRLRFPVPMGEGRKTKRILRERMKLCMSLGRALRDNCRQARIIYVQFDLAVRRIQAVIRSWLARYRRNRQLAAEAAALWLEHQNTTACHVQRLARGYLARRKRDQLWKRKEEKRQVRHSAASCIQMCWRRWKLRCRVVAVVKAKTRRERRRQKRRRREQERTVASKTIQRMIRARQRREQGRRMRVNIRRERRRRWEEAYFARKRAIREERRDLQTFCREIEGAISRVEEEEVTERIIASSSMSRDDSANAVMSLDARSLGLRPDTLSSALTLASHRYSGPWGGKQVGEDRRKDLILVNDFSGGDSSPGADARHGLLSLLTSNACWLPQVERCSMAVATFLSSPSLICAAVLENSVTSRHPAPQAPQGQEGSSLPRLIEHHPTACSTRSVSRLLAFAVVRSDFVREASVIAVVPTLRGGGRRAGALLVRYLSKSPRLCLVRLTASKGMDAGMDRRRKDRGTSWLPIRLDGGAVAEAQVRAVDPSFWL